MDIILMIVWLITAPMLVVCRWYGPALLFDIILVINVLSGFLGTVMIKDMTE